MTGQALFSDRPRRIRSPLHRRRTGPRGTVVGATDQVAGEIQADFDQTWRTQIGTIRINVRTLESDNHDRDQSVRAGVLESARSEYEFAEFTPTRIEGIPVRARVGTPMRVQVHGDFNVHGVVRPIVFFGIVTFTSPDELRGFLGLGRPVVGVRPLS